MLALYLSLPKRYYQLMLVNSPNFRHRILTAWEKLYAGARWLPGELLDLLCPPSCAVCRGEIPNRRDMLCTACWDRLREDLIESACPSCGRPAGPYELIQSRCHRCRNQSGALSEIIRVAPYSDVMRRLIIAFKYHRQCRLDIFLGSMLADAIIGSPQMRDVDLLVPVPLHWRRRLARGYNQSELLAHTALRQLKRQNLTIPVNRDLLRIRNTPPQTLLPAYKRRKNLRGAFATRPDGDFRDKHICLIDDVTTTGTTLLVAARTLRRAGARKISAAVLAVTDNP